MSFAPEVIDHLGWIDRKHHRTLRRRVGEQLSYTPLKTTRNRKPLEPPAPFGATWELRLGPRNRFRVFYEVDPMNREVSVLAIGVKQGSRLRIGGEEFES